eukprot:XP_011444475.2 PREDICTED: uncharacterized protein LOC105340218 isoform X1 [Crassostrea gigas]
MTTENHCMSLQCGNYPTFLTYECVDFLPPLCSTSILVNSTIINWSWTQSMKICKMNDTYLLGNINLSNVTSACLGNKHESPYWIGIFREKYFNTDQGQPIEQSARKFFNKCQRCKLNNEGAPECELVGCEKNLKKSAVICSEQSVATESSESLSSTDNSTIPIAVSVVLVLFLIAGCVIAIIIYKRRKNAQEKETKSAYCPPANKESERCSDTKTFNNTNYFVLQRPNSTYQLADNSKLELESPYNEAEEGTYNHLGEKRVRKKHDDDTYNHASSAELSDLSDYDVANRKHLNNEDNTYDHTGVGNDSYGKFKSDLSDYDVANREHRNEEDSTYDHTGVDSHGKYNSTQMNETDYSELS